MYVSIYLSRVYNILYILKGNAKDTFWKLISQRNPWYQTGWRSSAVAPPRLYVWANFHLSFKTSSTTWHMYISIPTRSEIHLIIILNVHECSHPWAQPRRVHQLLAGRSSLSHSSLERHSRRISQTNLKCPRMVDQINVLRLFKGEAQSGFHHKVGVAILLLSLLIFNLKATILSTCSVTVLLICF